MTLNKQKFKEEVGKLFESLKKPSAVNTQLKAMQKLNNALSKKREIVLIRSYEELKKMKSEGSELGSEFGSGLRSELWEYYESIFVVALMRAGYESRLMKKNIAKVEALEQINNAGIGYIMISKEKLIGISFDFLFKQYVIKQL